ncbi:MAG TPA: hypothetical protein VKV06_13225 [Acidimicrobiales bacterium]|nr:hypothetical protein [Acidimicrobiales bacterium]
MADPEQDPEVQTDLETIAAAEAELQAVEDALRRLDDGSYGWCRVCGTAIDASVLAEAPLTSTCGRCGGGEAATLRF